MEFYVTDVSKHRDFPGMWGFEIFTKERLYLGRFNFRSKAHARQAAKEFVWLMKKMSSLSERPIRSRGAKTKRTSTIKGSRANDNLA